jgi:hypothetical protein
MQGERSRLKTFGKSRMQLAWIWGEESPSQDSTTDVTNGEWQKNLYHCWSERPGKLPSRSNFCREKLMNAAVQHVLNIASGEEKSQRKTALALSSV